MEITYREYLELRAGLQALCNKLYGKELGNLITIYDYVEAARTIGLSPKDIDNLKHIQATDFKLQENIPKD